MPRPGIHALLLATFALSLGIAATASRSETTAALGALVWLPTGVAVAGLWLLGLRAAWVVALCTFATRLAADYNPVAGAAGAIGSTTEAVLAVLLLRRLRLHDDFARLRDVLVLLTAATTAPIASIVVSWITRLVVPEIAHYPFYSGWDGWWRMNVLGILTVVPPALIWGGRRGRGPAGDVTACCLVVLAAVALVTLIMLAVTPGAPAVMLLTMVLPLALGAALRLGPRGASASATSAAVAISTLAIHGVGAFEAVPAEQRHVAIQIFLVALVCVPLVFGALIAERDATAGIANASEGMRQALLRALPDITYRIAADGTFVGVDVPSRESLPLPAGQLIGRRIQDIASPEIASRMLEQLRRALRGEATVPVEYPMRAAQGRRDREMRFVPLPGGDALAVVRDITARKLAERQLAWHAAVLERIATSHAAREVFPLLLDGATRFLPECMSSILVRRGDRLFVGRALAVPDDFLKSCDGLPIGPEMGSCGAAAFRGTTVVTRDVAVDPLWAGARELVLRHGIRAVWSVPVRSPDGEVLGTFAFYFPEPREPDPAQVATIDRAAMLAGLAIDRERRAELLSSIERNISEGLFRSVPGKGIVHANDAFARMFGYASATELLLRNDALAGDDPQHRADLQALTDPTTAVSQAEVEPRRRDGSRFHALVSRTIVRDDTGTPILCDGTLADVTARKELERQLQQAQKMEAIGQLAGGIAHDFNNLLTAISGFAEAAREEMPAASRARQDIDEILRATQRAAALTRQMLAFGRRQLLQPRVVDLVTIVKGLGDMLARVIGEQHALVAHHATGTLAVRVDRSQIEQLLVNLVVNARDAMPAGGTIDITTGVVELDEAAARAHVGLSPGAHARIAVSDTGTGMTAEVKARAFDPFFTTKEPGKGTGLGLSTVYGIVRQSGGAVTIDSSPGQGTTVAILLPLADADPEDEPIVPIARPVARTGTVLVVEDEALVRELTQRTLTRAGHVVLTAGDGEAALAIVAAQAGALDVVVSDVVMPKMGGRELAARLRERWPAIPVLLMSGYVNEGEDQPQATGSVPFLHKPFTANELVAAVGRLLPVVAARPLHAEVRPTAPPVSGPPASA